jgi:NADH dehydrogenase [ubiquinone] 1 alpha subcomplex assembly factor 6
MALGRACARGPFLAIHTPRTCFPAAALSSRPFSSSSSSSSSSSVPPRAAPAPLTLEKLREQVRAGDFEGYLCGSLMPSTARESFFVMRALNIELAGVREAARGNAATGRIRMAFWRELIDKVYTRGAQHSHPLAQPLRAAVERHAHTRRWLERLVDARDGDLDGVAPASVSSLESYAERTAGSLLYLALESVGVRDERADAAASHIGKAMGICTLLRALPVHARMGQRYIPDELMEKVSE